MRPNAPYAGDSLEGIPDAYFRPGSLGRPHDANFKPFTGAPNLFAGTQETFDWKRYKGDFHVVTDRNELKASASAWGIGRASLSASSDTTWAVYRAYEITHCTSIKDEEGFVAEPPPRARWYPRSACYGRRFEAVFSTQESTVAMGLEAAFLTWGGSLEGFSQQHELQLRILAEGFERDPACKKLVFTDMSSFEQCFGDLPQASTPILIEWVELPVAAQRRRERERRERRAAARPCAKWRFVTARFDAGEKGLEIKINLTRPDGATRTYRGSSIDLSGDPIIARAGDTVSYRVQDEDWMFDDRLGSGTVTIPSRLENNQAVHHRFTLVGACIEREPPRRPGKQPGSTLD